MYLYVIELDDMNSRKIVGVLIDLSGTLHIGDNATDNAIDALKILRNTSLKLLFVTNTSKESGDDLKKRLDNIGFDIKADEIFSSLSAARELVSSRGYRPQLLLQPSAVQQFAGVPQHDPNAVVVGLAPDAVTYDNMNHAFRLLMRGAPLIAVHAGRYYKEEDGLSLGPGAYVRGLEYAAGVTAEVVGKPEKAFFEAALSLLGCTADQAVMIGDDVRDDVGGAQRAGLRGVLVRTGKYRLGDENGVTPGPTHTADSFAAAVQWLLTHCT